MENNESREKITPALLKSWSPCSDGYRRFCELFPDGADLQTAMDGLIADSHDDWAYWLFCACRDRNLFDDIVCRGYRNSGNRNSGDRNSGDQNSGHWNSGDQNSGDRNSGDWNSGHWNSGHWNSGDWNSGDQNSGYFNSITPDVLLVFNKICSRDAWSMAQKPAFLFFSLMEWIDESAMTEDEKQANPSCSFTGGYLRVMEYKEAWRRSWDNADPENRELVRKLPNFDAEVFFEITGIDLRGE